MTYADGMRRFKAGEYQAAVDQFLAAVQENDQDHRAWNALGICLSKTVQYEDAGVCFDNAIALDPDNETYKKNRERNNKKRGVLPEESLSLDDEPVKKPAGLSYSIWQIAGGVFVLFFALFLGGACVSSLGGAGSNDQGVVVPAGPVATATPKPAEVLTLTGYGSGSSDMVDLSRGLYQFDFDGVGGEHNFIISMRNGEGRLIGLLANAIGETHGSKKERVPSNGQYYFDVTGNEFAWSVKITKL